MNYCSNNYDATQQAKDEHKFRRHLRKFLTFNLILFILMLVGVGVSGLWKISLIWGAFLALKYRRFLDKKREEQWPEEEVTKREQYGRPRKPNWRRKDLV
ncbi:MAG: hypothetical protein D6772_09865 [Bacteroidetes bacterium]|nr:MAG: hypothetical protein D6772_09865 [Bacteroidota bacterium]